VSNLGDLGESWGICSDKPRLPGRGFDYTELELTAAASAGMEQLPGCGFIGLQMVGNKAKRYVITGIFPLILDAAACDVDLDPCVLGSVVQSSMIHVLIPRAAGSLESHHLPGPACCFLNQMLQVISHPPVIFATVALAGFCWCRQ
jgi:hypothetical protein